MFYTADAPAWYMKRVKRDADWIMIKKGILQFLRDQIYE
ncbi:hypothetical protein BSSX_0928 [Bacillus subtilis]|nr:hypothetical protein BSSX_0928 [Bacillus subtilis]